MLFNTAILYECSLMSSKALKQSCGKSRSPDSIAELKLLKLLNTSKDYLNISVVYVR